jgi:hypothetical protein
MNHVTQSNLKIKSEETLGNLINLSGSSPVPELGNRVHDDSYILYT